MGRKGQYSSSVQCCVGGQGESSGKRGHGGGPTHQLLVAQRGGGHGGGDASLAVVLGQRLQKEPRDLEMAERDVGNVISSSDYIKHLTIIEWCMFA